jgi:hypothetical protein
MHNCGGFFITVIRKLKDYGSIDKYNASQKNPARKRKHSDDVERIDTIVEQEAKIVGWAGGSKESPFIHIPADNSEIKRCWY